MQYLGNFLQVSYTRSFLHTTFAMMRSLDVVCKASDADISLEDDPQQKTRRISHKVVRIANKEIR